MRAAVSEKKRSRELSAPPLCDACAAALRCVCRFFAILVPLLCDACAAALRYVYRCSAMLVPPPCDACAAALRCLCRRSAIRVPLLCDACAASLRCLCRHLTQYFQYNILASFPKKYKEGSENIIEFSVSVAYSIKFYTRKFHKISAVGNKFIANVHSLFINICYNN